MILVLCCNQKIQIQAWLYKWFESPWSLLHRAPKNMGTQVGMDLSLDELLAFIAVKKIEILGAILELPAK